MIAKVSRARDREHFLRRRRRRWSRALLQEGRITARQADWPGTSRWPTTSPSRPTPAATPTAVRCSSCCPPSRQLRDELHASHGYARSRPGRCGGGHRHAGRGRRRVRDGRRLRRHRLDQPGLRRVRAVEATQRLLAEADFADVAMAPAADMFEMGVEVQVLKRGTLFPMRAPAALRALPALRLAEAIPAASAPELESAGFRRPLDDVWQECVALFEARDPANWRGPSDDPKRRMALVFRWYLGLPRVGHAGDPGRGSTTRSGAARRWALSTPGRAAASWRTSQGGVVQVAEISCTAPLTYCASPSSRHKASESRPVSGQRRTSSRARAFRPGTRARCWTSLFEMTGTAA